MFSFIPSVNFLLVDPHGFTGFDEIFIAFIKSSNFQLDGWQFCPAYDGQYLNAHMHKCPYAQIEISECLNNKVSKYLNA